MSEVKLESGAKLNEDLIKIIHERREALIRDGKFAKESDEPEELEVIDASLDIVIQKSDQEEYEALVEFERDFLVFNRDGKDELLGDQIYDIPGIKIGSGDPEYLLALDKDKLQALAKKAKEYERIFGKSLKIKFPNEIYQALYDDVIVTGTTLRYPPLKTVSESHEEYESRLEEYYKGAVIKMEIDLGDGKMWREPYPHELIDYKGDAPERKTENQSAYYELVEGIIRGMDPIEHAPEEPTPDAPETPTPERRGIVVKKSEALADTKLGTKLGSGFIGTLRSASAWKKLRYGLAFGAAAAAGIYLAVNIPLVAASLPAVGIYGLYKFCKNKFQKRKDKKRAEEATPVESVPETPGLPEGPEAPTAPVEAGGEEPPHAEPEPVAVDAPAHEATTPEIGGTLMSLMANLADLKNIEDIILNEETLEATLVPTDPEYESKKAEYQERLRNLKSQKRNLLENLRIDVDGIYESYSVETGGPKL